MRSFGFAFFMPAILLKMKALQDVVRNFFATPLRRLLGFFANLRTTCEGFAKKGKLCLCSVPKKVDGKRPGLRATIRDASLPLCLVAFLKKQLRRYAIGKQLPFFG